MQEKIAEILEVLFGFRKFIFILLLMVVGIVFRIQNLIDGSQFVDLLKQTAVAFIASSGFEHALLTAKEYWGSKEVALINGNSPNDPQAPQNQTAVVVQPQPPTIPGAQ